MTDYTLSNTKPKKVKIMSEQTKRRYNQAVKKIHTRNPTNLRQAIQLIIWAEGQP